MDDLLTLSWGASAIVKVGWVELHGALTHFPVALLFLAGALEAGALALRRPQWRTASLWMLAGGVASGVPAVVTGWLSADRMFADAPAPPDLGAHRWAALATVAAGGAALAWRLSRRDAAHGKAVAASASLVFVTCSLVGYTGYLGGRMVFGSGQASSSPAAGSTSSTAGGASLRQAVSLEDVAHGASLFASRGCQSCHAVGGSGGRIGPDLTIEASRHPDPAWQVDHLRDPARFSPGSPMPRFRDLSGGDLRALAAYLATRR